MRKRTWSKALLYLGPSKIHGIGCYSDIVIRKGEFVRVFAPEDSRWVPVKKANASPHKQLIKKFARSKSGYGYYGISYWVGRLISRLPPAEALPKLEALLPTLPEKMIDQLLDSVTELKQGTPTAAST